ncbi:type IV secretory system conjugative DNA transfer family protein, partial [Acinetobacter baumannii]
EAGTPLTAACVRALNDFITLSVNTRTGVRKTFTSRLELWFNPLVDAATSESDFDLRDLRKRRMSVYIAVTPDDLARVQPILNLFFQQLLDVNT